MIKNSTKEYLTFLGLLTLGLFSFSPVSAEPPEEMRLDLTFQNAFHADVTQVKVECSITGRFFENGMETSGVVARAEKTFPRPLSAIDNPMPTVVSVFFEPVVDDFSLDRHPNYLCETYVRSDDQDWVGVAVGERIPAIGRISRGLGEGTAMSGISGRNLRFGGSLRGQDLIRD